MYLFWGQSLFSGNEQTYNTQRNDKRSELCPPNLSVDNEVVAFFSFIVNWKQLRFHFFHWSFVCCLFACCLKNLSLLWKSEHVLCVYGLIKISIPVNLLYLSILYRMLAINFVSDLSSFVLMDVSLCCQITKRVWHGTPPPPPPPSANHHNSHQRPEPWPAYIVSKTFLTLWNAAECNERPESAVPSVNER